MASSETPIQDTNTFMTGAQVTKENEAFEILVKYSSFNKCRRILAYCARWRLNSKSKNKQIHKDAKHMFNAQEWSTALRYCFAAVQRIAYKKEISTIQEERSLRKLSDIMRLSPFIDEEGILRVGGRLEYATLPYDERHPVILPGNNPIVRRYVKNIHEELAHGGPQLILSHLYRSVWITQAPRVVSSITRTCVKCQRYSAITGQQQMVPLPFSRTTPQRPYAISGLDLRVQLKYYSQKEEVLRKPKLTQQYSFASSPGQLTSRLYRT